MEPGKLQATMTREATHPVRQANFTRRVWSIHDRGKILYQLHLSCSFFNLSSAVYTGSPAIFTFTFGSDSIHIGRL